MSRQFPLAALLAAAFALGCVNVVVTGSIRMPNGWQAAEQLLLYGLGYWWFYVDKQRLEFPAGKIQKIGVAFVPVVSIPVYLFRSRGVMRGALAFVGFAAFFVAMIASAILGGALGSQLAPW